ncbi:MAG: hypothetical protein WC783_03290 [Candidatus Paceibacterota bacterium]|jgi:hypothetical protein
MKRYENDYKDYYRAIIIWLMDGEVGLSSKAMLSVWLKENYCPVDIRTDHPLDPADLKRCMDMMDQFYFIKIESMKDISKEWCILVDNWDKLTTLLKEEIGEFDTGSAPKTYKLMQELLG